jgi:hypothetical protein
LASMPRAPNASSTRCAPVACPAVCGWNRGLCCCRKVGAARGGLATMALRGCYIGRAALLRSAANLATMGGSWVLRGPDLATMGGSACYKGRPALLHGARRRRFCQRLSRHCYRRTSMLLPCVMGVATNTYNVVAALTMQCQVLHRWSWLTEERHRRA